MNNIKSFSIYSEYIELISLLDETEQKDLIYRIVRYVFYDEKPKSLSDSQNKIWKNLKRPIDKSKTKSKATSKRQSKQNQNDNQNINQNDNDIKDVIVNVNVNVNNNLFSYIEKIFGRTLSSTEYEVINTWEDNELTRYAIKQAELSRVFNIKYIQAILNSYKENNITTVQEAETKDKKFQEKKKAKDCNAFKKAPIPGWMSKESEKEPLTEDEKKEMDELLKEFK